MGVLATLETRSLGVTPGAQAMAEFRVRNNGTVVDQFTIDVLGDASQWSSVQPQSLNLFPNKEERARIVFKPPRSYGVLAGPMPFGIRVRSRANPAVSTVDEGVLHVAAFMDTGAELAPRTSRGRREAAHDLEVENRGNARVDVGLSAVDPDRLLDFEIRPPVVPVDPGQIAHARVLVRPRDRFWRGAPKTHSFRVEVGPPGSPPISLDGTLVQEPLLPPWIVPVVGLLLLPLRNLAALIVLAVVMPLAARLAMRITASGRDPSSGLFRDYTSLLASPFANVPPQWLVDVASGINFAQLGWRFVVAPIAWLGVAFAVWVAMRVFHRRS